MYLDNIIIWSKILKEHCNNIAKILDTFKETYLFCSLKKSNIFCTEIDFLGHHISEHGIEADLLMVEKILVGLFLARLNISLIFRPHVVYHYFLACSG